MLEILEMLWEGFMARPELVIVAVIIFAIFCLGEYFELKKAREENDERCRIISERSKMR
jgi:hypothetical protein